MNVIGNKINNYQSADLMKQQDNNVDKGKKAIDPKPLESDIVQISQSAMSKLRLYNSNELYEGDVIEPSKTFGAGGGDGVEPPRTSGAGGGDGIEPPSN